MLDRLLEYINNCTEVRAVLNQQDGSYYVETEYYSKLGEDVIGTVWFDEEKPESLIEALKKSLDDIYDKYEEDLELYVKERPRGAENFTVRQLVDDADWKVKFWHGFVRDVLEWYYSTEDNTTDHAIK